MKLSNIPLVESGYRIYDGLKKKNRLVNWSLQTVEGVVLAAAETVQPAVRLFEKPISVVDKVVCRGIDFVEQKIPSIYLPPEMMYSNTKEYMTDHIVRPVIKRANSVKQIGNAVLDSRVSTYAADRIDGAINVADKYVEKYLPPEDQTDSSVASDDISDSEECKAVHTLHKSQRFSRKLKRRLTQRTFAEARALKKQSKEAIHVLLYAAELIAYNPREALVKAGELWNYLSEDEPENQARPQTLEQLIVLLTRESARKVVHLANYTKSSAAKVPRTMMSTSREIVHQTFDASGSLFRLVRLDRARALVVDETSAVIGKIQFRYEEMQQYSSHVLERFALFLSGRMEPEKITVSRRRHRIRKPTENAAQNNINGVY